MAAMNRQSKYGRRPGIIKVLTERKTHPNQSRLLTGVKHQSILRVFLHHASSHEVYATTVQSPQCF